MHSKERMVGYRIRASSSRHIQTHEKIQDFIFVVIYIFCCCCCCCCISHCYTTITKTARYILHTSKRRYTVRFRITKKILRDSRKVINIANKEGSRTRMREKKNCIFFHFSPGLLFYYGTQIIQVGQMKKGIASVNYFDKSKFVYQYILQVANVFACCVYTV